MQAKIESIIENAVNHQSRWQAQKITSFEEVITEMARLELEEMLSSFQDLITFNTEDEILHKFTKICKKRFETNPHAFQNKAFRTCNQFFFDTLLIIKPSITLAETISILFPSVDSYFSPGIQNDSLIIQKKHLTHLTKSPHFAYLSSLFFYKNTAFDLQEIAQVSFDIHKQLFIALQNSDPEFATALYDLNGDLRKLAADICNAVRRLPTNIPLSTIYENIKITEQVIENILFRDSNGANDLDDNLITYSELFAKADQLGNFEAVCIKTQPKKNLFELGMCTISLTLIKNSFEHTSMDYLRKTAEFISEFFRDTPLIADYLTLLPQQTRMVVLTCLLLRPDEAQIIINGDDYFVGINSGRILIDLYSCPPTMNVILNYFEQDNKVYFFKKLLEQYSKNDWVLDRSILSLIRNHLGAFIFNYILQESLTKLYNPFNLIEFLMVFPNFPELIHFNNFENHTSITQKSLHQNRILSKNEMQISKKILSFSEISYYSLFSLKTYANTTFLQQLIIDKDIEIIKLFMNNLSRDYGICFQVISEDNSEGINAFCMALCDIEIFDVVSSFLTEKDRGYLTIKNNNFSLRYAIVNNALEGFRRLKYYTFQHWPEVVLKTIKGGSNLFHFAAVNGKFINEILFHYTADEFNSQTFNSLPYDLVVQALKQKNDEGNIPLHTAFSCCLVACQNILWALNVPGRKAMLSSVNYKNKTPFDNYQGKYDWDTEERFSDKVNITPSFRAFLAVEHALRNTQITFCHSKLALKDILLSGAPTKEELHRWEMQHLSTNTNGFFTVDPQYYSHLNALYQKVLEILGFDAKLGHKRPRVNEDRAFRSPDFY